MRKVGSPRRTCAPTGSTTEAQASGGDPLRLTHLFGISDPAAIRYCAEIGIPGLTKQ